MREKLGGGGLKNPIKNDQKSLKSGKFKNFP